MKMQRNIKLRLNEVKDFVEAASRCNFDIDIFYNRYVVDAKSILGVYGLDLTKILTVSYDGYDSAFEEVLKGLAVAC
ncbi:MAG: HPr family phosphocarrier protein [Lachnospiraceae bacterium]|nr:HPr family phosphocarrier protein [Lachnospiraceae bacterium]